MPASTPSVGAAASRSRQRRRAYLALTGLTALLSGALIVPPASAASVTSAVFSGAGTVSNGGMVFAKQGQSLTLTVVTSSDTQCVDIAGAFAAHQESATPKSSWTFTTTAAAGDGVKAVTAAASTLNNGGNCRGATATTQASYTLDNTGPVVSAAATPAPNAAGWNNSDVTVRWTATEAGSGVAGSQPFKTDSVTANGIVNLSAAAQTDRLGNTGQPAAVTVRVDKAAPTITAAETKNPDGTRTITFTCSDSSSGGGQGSGINACVADGTTTNSKTVAGGVTVTGTATDNAGNTAKASLTASASDTTPPNLSGAPTTAPNGTNGWYTRDVTIDWSCSDSGSGLAAGACPADDTISSEGQNLTVTRSLSDIAGNTTTATSAPAVKIDKTAPNTGISGDSNNWVNDQVTLTLAPSDNLSGVASTSYKVNGGAAQSGRTVSLSDDGQHTVEFFSTDNAGNVEQAKSVQVKIDQTAPIIGHSFTPSYTSGTWTKNNVTVSFDCADQGSGVASCTGDKTVETEGADQAVVGTATDNAGNSANDTALVSIDKTPPSVDAVLTGGTKNAAGWYKDDVIVSFSASDTLSGLASKSADKVLGEGRNQSASGSATDAAGNSASAIVSGIDVDKTAPVLTAKVPGGWHTDDVTVTWSCTDALSGVDMGPADDVVTGEGDNLSSSASCTDNAGNMATKTVDGITIDRTAPTTLADLPEAPASGWYAADVKVQLDASDSLSGVAQTFYQVGSGAAQTYSGAISLGEGEHNVKFWSKDNAGNVETASAPLTIKIDKTVPDTQVINPISPDSGWFVTSGIPVAFKATDSGSGVAATYYKIDGGEQQTYGDKFTAPLSDGTHTITYWSVDLAGNVEMKDTETFKTVTVSVDTQAPTVTPADVTNTTWRNTPLSETFTATDAGSGLADTGDASFSLTASVESTKEANNAVVPTSVSKTVADKAGNATTRTVSALIDLTKPVDVSFVGGPAEGTRYYTSTVPAAPTCTATDTLSGLGNCTVTGYVTGEGTHSLVATATDKAGNVATASRSYTVKNLTRKGFTAPVDMNGVYNTIKGGNTVPLKFEVFDGTTELKTTAAVKGFSAIKVTCDSDAPVDAIELFATAGQTELRFDTTGDQFIQNWKTPTGSGCYRATMTTVDGQSISALFKTLR